MINSRATPVVARRRRRGDAVDQAGRAAGFYGDLFAHVVAWEGELYLEDGVHRALRGALQSRKVLPARVLRLPG